MSSNFDVLSNQTQFDITTEAIKKLKEQGLGFVTLRLFFASLSFLFKATDDALYSYILPIAVLMDIVWFYLSFLEAKTTRNINFNLSEKLVTNFFLAVLGIVGCILLFGFGISSFTLLSALVASFYGIKAIAKMGLSLSYAIRFFYAEPGTERAKECKDRAKRYIKSAIGSLMSAVVAAAITMTGLVGGPIAWVVLSTAFLIKFYVNKDAISRELLPEKSSIKEIAELIKNIEDKPLKKILTKQLIHKRIKRLEMEDKYLIELQHKARHAPEFSIRMVSWGRIAFYSLFPQKQKEEITLLKKLASEVEGDNAHHTIYPEGFLKNDTYDIYQLLLHHTSSLGESQRNKKPIIYTDTIIEMIHMIEDKKLREKFLLMLIDNKIATLASASFNIYKKEKINFLINLKEILQSSINSSNVYSPDSKVVKILTQLEGQPTESDNSFIAAKITQLVSEKLDDSAKKTLQKVFFSAKKHRSETELLYYAALSHACQGTVELHEPGYKKGKFYYKDISASIKKIKEPEKKAQCIIELLQKKIDSFGSNPKGKHRHKKEALLWCLNWLKGGRLATPFSITRNGKQYDYQFDDIEDWLKVIRQEHPVFQRQVFISKLDVIGETDGMIGVVCEFHQKYPEKPTLSKILPFSHPIKPSEEPNFSTYTTPKMAMQ